MTPHFPQTPQKDWESVPALALRSGELNGGRVAPLPKDFGEQHPRAGKLVEDIFERCPGQFAVRLWNGETTVFGHGEPRYTIVFNAPSALRKLALTQSPLALADAYFSGDVDIEGDFYAAVELKDQLGATSIPLDQKITTAWHGLWLTDNTWTPRQGALQADERGDHSRDHNRRSIAFHYDVSNEFYRLFLDSEMVYSCAYFKDGTEDIDAAQRNKLDHICRKLRLQPGELFLDIGCGWGALAIWAARNYDVYATGITLSQRQYEYATERVRQEGLEDRVKIELRDYRDLDDAQYDKVASVGMIEHVGLKNLPLYFDTVNRLLKPGGLFLSHGITHDTEGWKNTISTRFINRYVFPDGELDTPANIMGAMERAQFEIWDVEGLRPHYAKTLRHWVERLEANHAEALRHVDEAIYRTWRLYMAASALQFEEGDIGIYQMLGSKRGAQTLPVPLTRSDLYR
jgi:cyclopropane-fatty-acyl-phospholipid synthase